MRQASNHKYIAATRLTSAELEKRAQSGGQEDINYMMGQLETNGSFLNCKLLDHALGLVSSEEGRERIRYYLFNGSRIQRNYAALYFKRRGITEVIDEAVTRGSIDEIQAYAR